MSQYEGELGDMQDSQSVCHGHPGDERPTLGGGGGAGGGGGGLERREPARNNTSQLSLSVSQSALTCPASQPAQLLLHFNYLGLAWPHASPLTRSGVWTIFTSQQSQQ